MQKDIKVDKLALRMDNLSASDLSSSPIDKAVSPKQMPSNILELLQTSKISALEATDICKIFMDGYKQIGQEKYSSNAFLLVDLRPACLFSTSRVVESVNPGLPPLVQKRLKKRMFSNFSLSNFLLPSCQERLNAWRSLDEKFLVVYDDLMDNYEGDAWTFLLALTDGLAKDMCPEKVPSLAFVSGGYNALSDILEMKQFSYNEPKTPDSGLKREESLADFSPQSNGSTPKTALRKPPRSLAIDIAAKKDSSAKKPSLNLVIVPKREHSKINDGPASALSSASPNDNAAPTDDYSKITSSIIVGSDVLPLSPIGPQLLSGIGVTHILNMAAEIKNSKLVEDSGLFKIKWIPVLDNIEVDMDQALQEAITFIGNRNSPNQGDAIAQSPKSVVFVHCKAGRSRSVSAVIGYLVSKERYTLKSAYDLVRKVRKGVSPNLGFMAALLKVEKDTHGENSRISDLYG